jgi:hypothetical protein
VKPGGGSKLVNKYCHFVWEIKNQTEINVEILWKYLGEYKPKNRAF